MNYQRIILRAETKIGERRAILTPSDARSLYEQSGIPIWVERSQERIFNDEEYKMAGCLLMPPGLWLQAGYDSLVLGLKELPRSTSSIRADHIYFSHSFRGQAGAQHLLQRFASGKGRIFDLEFLTESTGKRLVAFGHWAGFVGAALGIARYYGGLEKPLVAFENLDRLIKSLDLMKSQSPKTAPRVVITGSLGRAGKGARALLTSFAEEIVEIDQHNVSELQDQIPGFDLLVHCVGGTASQRPVLTRDQIKDGMRLSIVVDVTCDASSSFHLLPFYSGGTSFQAPVMNCGPLDVIAIDHLPSLLPKESSMQFSAELLPLLLNFLESPDHSVWKRCLAQFNHAITLAEINQFQEVGL